MKLNGTMTLDIAAVVGDRVEVEGHIGTVCYVGEIAGAGSGVWLGVDWDDESRGKHDGSHKGVRYFVTRTPTSGSLVRPHKVNMGRLCYEAIEEQYEPLQQDKLDSMQREAIFKANKAQVKAFEFVGFEKVLKKTSQHENLTHIDLRNKNIKGGDSRLAHICNNLIELDIRQNLFASWESIGSLTKYMPHLEVLNISQNRISRSADVDALRPNFLSVRHLIAGRMGWTLADLLLAADLLPNLHSLQVIENQLTILDPSLGSYFPNLLHLDLGNNPLNDWGEVLKLSQMPSLEALHLQNTGISRIHFPPDETQPFPALKTLILSSNKIGDWGSVSALQQISSLLELSFRNNPVLEAENFETNRQIMICRVPQLRVLDKIAITEVERRGAALDYLKKYGSSYLQARGEVSALQLFHETHPCYQRLVDQYGAPEEAELVSGTAKLRSLLIALTFRCPQHSQNVVSKKVPRTMKVQKLRGMLQKLFSSPGTQLQLSYRSQDKPDITYTFDNDLKDLAFYSIQEGDEIIVSW